ncbi:MAG: hypothetical protein LBD32_00970 [Cytophagales bacterium]|nr:hypothetical protein [Cytophagales bacterium]
MEGKGIDFDIVCPKTESQNIQTLVGALGSYLWDAMPEIRKKFGFNIIYPEEINLFKSLYGDSHPLLK